MYWWQAAPRRRARRARARAARGARRRVGRRKHDGRRRLRRAARRLGHRYQDRRPGSCRQPVPAVNRRRRVARVGARRARRRDLGVVAVGGRRVLDGRGARAQRGARAVERRDLWRRDRWRGGVRSNVPAYGRPWLHAPGRALRVRPAKGPDHRARSQPLPAGPRADGRTRRARAAPRLRRHLCSARRRGGVGDFSRGARRGAARARRGGVGAGACRVRRGDPRRGGGARRGGRRPRRAGRRVRARAHAPRHRADQAGHRL
mmetsp:Transcript_16699/g.51910  ORF Transcript_16699/g.51910 Transcript_16699/m.51910 type:complete len:261 (+) Transcript_16699:1114-1896(+)